MVYNMQYMKDTDIIYAFFVSLPVKELSMNQLKALGVPFRITETNVRSMLSRLHARNLIDVRREGRTAYYRLSSRGTRIGSNIGYHFREPNWTDWKGLYWGMAFTESDGSSRYKLRKKLTAYRFRALYPGLWIRPLNPREKIPEVFSEQAGAIGFDLFSCRFHQELSLERIAEIYELDAVTQVLSDALVKVERSIESITDLSPAEAFRDQILLGDVLVHALAADPLLPPALLPNTWPAARLRNAFEKWNRLFAKYNAPFVRSALRLEKEERETIEEMS